MAVLLSCRKHGIYMSSRNEGDDYIVVFLNRLEVHKSKNTDKRYCCYNYALCYLAGVCCFFLAQTKWWR